MINWLLKRVGQRRKDRRGEGQITDSLEALRPALGAHKRLGPQALLEYGLKIADGEANETIKYIDSIVEGADYKRFTEQRAKHKHFRCISQILFWERIELENSVPYIEHPTTGQLLPIFWAIRNWTNNGHMAVWVSSFREGCLIADEKTLMYISDEPSVLGNTLEEVEARYHA